MTRIPLHAGCPSRRTFRERYGAYGPMLSTTVIVWPPGFTVSCPSRVTRLVEVTVIVTLAPEASDPEDGETVRWPASADPAVIE